MSESAKRVAETVKVERGTKDPDTIAKERFEAYQTEKTVPKPTIVYKKNSFGCTKPEGERNSFDTETRMYPNIFVNYMIGAPEHNKDYKPMCLGYTEKDPIYASPDDKDLKEEILKQIKKKEPKHRELKMDSITWVYRGEGPPRLVPKQSKLKRRGAVKEPKPTLEEQLEEAAMERMRDLNEKVKKENEKLAAGPEILTAPSGVTHGRNRQSKKGKKAARRASKKAGKKGRKGSKKGKRGKKASKHRRRA